MRKTSVRQFLELLRRPGRATTLLRGVFTMLLALPFAILRAVLVRAHRRPRGTLRIWRTAEALLRLRPRTRRPGRHLKWTTHFTELRSHLKPLRAIEISHLRSALLRRARAHLAGIPVVLPHLRRRAPAGLPRFAALRETGHLVILILRESGMGPMPSAIQIAALVTGAWSALRLRILMAICRRDRIAPLAGAGLRHSLMTGVAGVSHVRCVRSRTVRRSTRRPEISALSKVRWPMRSVGLRRPTEFVMVG